MVVELLLSGRMLISGLQSRLDRDINQYTTGRIEREIDIIDKLTHGKKIRKEQMNKNQLKNYK